MRELLGNMRFLATKICAEASQEPDVRGVLLFGSVAKGNVHAGSDIDIVIVKEGQQEPIKRREHERDGIQVDMWEHSLSNYEKLFQKDWNHSMMFMNSLFLNILQNCEIIYDPHGRFCDYREKALKWSWPSECRDFVEQRLRKGLDTVRKIDDTFEKLTSMRRLLLVKACRHLLEIGKPVSARNKDYYLMFSELNQELSMKDFRRVFGRTPTIEELNKSFRHTLVLFSNEVTEREPWTELVDARKHLSSGEVFLAAISLQNGAYYLGCRGLRNRKVRREETGYLWPESEVELIKKSKENWQEFYELYYAMHNAQTWQLEEVDECLKQIFAKDGS